MYYEKVPNIFLMRIKQLAKRCIPIIAREVDCRQKYKFARKFLSEHLQPELTSQEKKDIDLYWGGV